MNRHEQIGHEERDGLSFFCSVRKKNYKHKTSLNFYNIDNLVTRVLPRNHPSTGGGDLYLF